MVIKTNENFIPFFNSDFHKASRDGLGNRFWIDTRLLSVKVKCPDPGVASHDQKPDRGIVSGIKSSPLARTPPPPPPHGIYIDRCITKSREWVLSKLEGEKRPFLFSYSELIESPHAFEFAASAVMNS